MRAETALWALVAALGAALLVDRLRRLRAAWQRLERVRR